MTRHEWLEKMKRMALPVDQCLLWHEDPSDFLVDTEVYLCCIEIAEGRYKYQVLPWNESLGWPEEVIAWTDFMPYRKDTMYE